MPKTKKWSHNVTTDSTYPPGGIFTKDGETIAPVMSSPEVSPNGIGSGIRMVQLLINRAGKNLLPKESAGKSKKDSAGKTQKRKIATTFLTTSATA